MSSDEEIGRTMTGNEELRLCGMAGDDEDDILGDAEELFGSAVAESHANLTSASASDGNSGTSGAGEPQQDAAGDGLPQPDANGDGDGRRAPVRNSTSACWDDFTKLTKKVN
ncbi:hypothetical protein SORBI_3002G196700, partial [Sorghum bicolor]